MQQQQKAPYSGERSSRKRWHLAFVAFLCGPIFLLSGCGASSLASRGSSGNSSTEPTNSEVAARLARETAGLKPITGPIDFNAQIRPILSPSCFACHGPDADMRKAGLRLDYAQPALTALADKPDRHAIVPGHPEQSEVVRRITSDNPQNWMPHGMPRLDPKQIQLVAEWIKQGAKYEPIWSLIPPKEWPVPQTAQFEGRVVNPIDSFIFAGLAKKGLAPSPEADRATLINRVSLTLTGLPPTLDEVDTFVHDKSPNAYEKVVDRLLGSPAYGENIAGMWMDLSRWADTDGSLDDAGDRYLWPWRDWVIESFNENMPYDKFVTMQLAGDLMPHRTRNDLLATAFLRLGERATENGDIDEQFRVEAVVDDTDTVGQALMGYTVGCAACHDHKYDPVSQKDFYSLSGFFNSLDSSGVIVPGYSGLQDGPTLPWPTATQQLQLTRAQLSASDSTDAYGTALDKAMQQAQREVAAWITEPRALRASQQRARSASRFVQTSLVESDGRRSGQGGVAAAERLIQSSLRQAQVAYYPFDSETPIPQSAWPILKNASLPDAPKGLNIQLVKRRFLRPLPRRPNVGVGAEVKGGKGAVKSASTRNPAFNPYVPTNYDLAQMKFSPSGLSGVTPAVISDSKLGPGVHGQALYFNENQDSKAYLTGNVGNFDRWQQFSFDLWFYPVTRYKSDVPIFDHANGQNSDSPLSGNAGYELALDEQGNLTFYLAHARPFDMIAVTSRAQLPLKRWARITVSYDGSSKAAGVHIYIDGKPVPVDVVRDNLTRTILPWSGSGLNLDPCLGIAFGARFRESAPVGSAVDDFRVFDRALTPVEVSYLSEGARALQANGSTLQAELANLLAIREPSVIKARHALELALQQETQIASSIPEVLVFENSPQPRPTYLLVRGAYDAHADQVPLQAPTQLFPWTAKYPRNRLGLAQWLFDPKNPLTARVFVNRLWQMNFGFGLVKTQDDFGSQGDMPTYPQLLDWLALRFMNSGWNVKQMEKLIVMSATFRQSSDATPEALKSDPTDALLARGPRFRMNDRQIRDSALFDAGVLDGEMGGPSTYPYQPDGVWNRNNAAYVGRYPEPGEQPASELHRRTLYTYIKRTVVNPQLELLDAADPTVSTGRMEVSNTPMQGLLLLDSPQYQEAYRLMATRAMHYSGDPAKQITQVFRLARRVYPDAQQLTVLSAFYNKELERYQADPRAAEGIVHIGVTPVDRSVGLVKLAALTNVASLIMSAPDSIFIQ